MNTTASPFLVYARGLIYRFVRGRRGQDFAEYALIFGAIGIVALAVLTRYRTELIAAFNSGIAALRASH
jgi:Flp pilus assembly pilin Flp